MGVTPTTTPGVDETSKPGATPETGTPTTSPSETQETPSPSDAATELEALKAALKKANNEAAGHRHKANELDKLKAEIEASKLSETEKLQKQLAELQAKHDQISKSSQNKTVEYEVRLEALAMGIDPKVAAKLIELSEITVDDNGTPTNVPDLLKKMQKEYPTLTGGKQPTSNAGGATKPSQSAASSHLSWDIITAMTPQQYAARQPEIMAFMRDNPAPRR